MALRIFVRAHTGQEWTFFFTEERFKSTTVLQLKTKITEIEEVPEDHLRLIFAGRQLEDYWLLSDCGVKHGDTIGLELIRMRDTEGRHQTHRFPVQVKSAAEATDTTAMAVGVTVCSPTGEERLIGLCDTEEQLKTMTVLQLKEKIVSTFRISGYDLSLVLGSEFLEEGALLSAYEIRRESVIHTVLILPGGGYSLGALYRGMGDREGRNLSMENIADFEKCTSEAQEPK